MTEGPVRFNSQRRLCKYDYGFLKGDTEMWPSWGAGFAVTMEWNKNMGYGSFDDPTPLGQKAIEDYELHHMAIDYTNV